MSKIGFYVIEMRSEPAGKSHHRKGWPRRKRTSPGRGQVTVWGSARKFDAKYLKIKFRI